MDGGGGYITKMWTGPGSTPLAGHQRLRVFMDVVLEQTYEMGIRQFTVERMAELCNIAKQLEHEHAP